MAKRTGPVKEPGTPAGRSRRTAKSTEEEQASEITAAADRETPQAPLGDEPGEIRENIEQTRAQMGGTLGALQEKLSPSNVKEQVKESVQEHIAEAKSALRAATVGKVEHMIRDTGNTLSGARQTLWETIRENPLPAALSAIGLTWLFLNRGGREDGRRFASDGRYAGFEDDAYGRGYGGYGADRGLDSRAGGTVRRVKDRASDLVDSAQEKAGDLASTATDAASRVADRAQIQVRRVEQTLGRWLDDNPIALGAVALAAGTAIGLALPRTEKEDRLLGSARDTVVDKAQQLASTAVDNVRDRLSDTQDQQQQTH